MTKRQNTGRYIVSLICLFLGWGTCVLAVLFFCNVTRADRFLPRHLGIFVQSLSGSVNTFPAMLAMGIPSLVALLWGGIAWLLENPGGKSLVRFSVYLVIVTEVAVLLRGVVLAG